MLSRSAPRVRSRDFYSLFRSACLQQIRLHGQSTASPRIFPPTINELAAAPLPEDEVTVTGWVRTVRKLKNVAFASVNDGSSGANMQVVLKHDQLEGLTTGTSVQITGRYEQSTKGKGQQDRELKASNVQVLGASDGETYPMQKKYHGAEHLRQNAHLRPRTSSTSALLRLRSKTMSALNNFFDTQSFTQTHPPILTSSDCEGAGEVFSISTSTSSPKGAKDKGGFFGHSTYLTVSTQLHLEALAHGLGRVWCVCPAFRAETSLTNRHLAEFWMLEAEVAFVREQGELMTLTEEMIRHVAKGLLENPTAAAELAPYASPTAEGNDTKIDLPSRWRGLARDNWTRMSYTTAVNHLQHAVSTNLTSFKFPPIWGHALQSEHEKWLAGEFVKGPVFVHDYPASLKPFYMLPSLPSNTVSEGATVACFDLLVPEMGELVGGSLRQHDAAALESQIEKAGMKAEEMAWYVELRKWGSVPHGGFGMGFDRFLAYLGGVENLREVVAFPRWAKHCKF
ncbi:hypothetical protein G7K_2142-t1 [Saitoella complicata NRRL Y-17804]|uniref:asparagine--tRNA ligase n=1 Tax=Saitoella complicata (strain BCRC 22490 / CBS 7301 / JCM 7358 / NBRC 10748 / NRRL Y-17804) TaxID=698492 RepID=A0A0E9NDM1_SAICN|nr:hypothetical protein G7K_2142-t1 [Saitoella complicata NRRL Y-17804]